MKPRTGQGAAGLREGVRTVVVLVGVLGSVALGLRLLSLVPPALAEEPFRSYDTIEEAHRATGLPLHLPAYFPDYLQWPPVEIRGRKQPGPAVSATVLRRDSDQPVLWLDEWVPYAAEPRRQLPETARELTREEVALREGVRAEVVGYVEQGAELSYRLTWDQNGVRISLRAALPRDELLRMARSMSPLSSY